ncbi:hypothetical protein RRSWK_06826 [Rhodopirellula sp. SWK7]|nr:hypothetical protein RRSWK_06826 [Rhodopirellula sp. SWK7]
MWTAPAGESQVLPTLESRPEMQTPSRKLPGRIFSGRVSVIAR